MKVDIALFCLRCLWEPSSCYICIVQIVFFFTRSVVSINSFIKQNRAHSKSLLEVCFSLHFLLLTVRAVHVLAKIFKTEFWKCKKFGKIKYQKVVTVIVNEMFKCYNCNTLRQKNYAVFQIRLSHVNLSLKDWHI